MERRQLEFFLAIAEAGSITRAAARLRVAQPSLSYALRTLERELGAELFERLGRGVRLTPAGEALVGPARRTVRSFGLAAGAVRSLGADGHGELRIVASTLWAIEPLAPILAAFRQVLPGVQVVVTDPRHRADVLEQVRSGEAQFGLLDGPTPAGVFDAQFVLDQELVAVLPPGTAWHAATISVDELADRGLISTPEGTALRDLLDQRLDEAGRPGDVAITTAHVASVVPLVLAGAGVALLPEGLAAAARREGAPKVRLDRPSQARVSLVWRRGELDPVAAQFVAGAQELFAGDS
ncbi:LysR family transcriptional regulator [Nocardioides humi]|uniref:HTH lysR-type domain-containing protein n=1 Tax=Nocardioides humi TaxID=449461 RepID=A0ABN2BFA4_9ACTN|nr:LysR family transcriptional regulator [Nocardioides humi]